MTGVQPRHYYTIVNPWIAGIGGDDPWTRYAIKNLCLTSHRPSISAVSPHPQFCFFMFNSLQIREHLLLKKIHILKKKKSTYKWTCTIQTHVICIYTLGSICSFAQASSLPRKAPALSRHQPHPGGSLLQAVPASSLLPLILLPGTSL